MSVRHVKNVLVYLVICDRMKEFILEKNNFNAKLATNLLYDQMLVKDMPKSTLKNRFQGNFEFIDFHDLLASTRIC